MNSGGKIDWGGGGFMKLAGHLASIKGVDKCIQNFSLRTHGCCHDFFFEGRQRVVRKYLRKFKFKPFKDILTDP
jgi:hypothetical protein